MYRPVILAFMLASNATRESPGTISLRSSRRFGISSAAKFANPVTFPPGRARLATNFKPTGSPTRVKTTGIVVVKLFAYGAALFPTTTKTSISNDTSSAPMLLNFVGEAMLELDVSPIDVAEAFEAFQQ